MKRKTAVLMAAMMLALSAASAPVFAQPAGFAQPTKEDSCGAPNPDFAGQPLKERTLGTCGVENNPQFPDKPESPLFG